MGFQNEGDVLEEASPGIASAALALTTAIRRAFSCQTTGDDTTVFRSLPVPAAHIGETR